MTSHPTSHPIRRRPQPAGRAAIYLPATLLVLAASLGAASSRAAQPNAQQREIRALQEQLRGVLSQLDELSRQNQILLQHQRQIEEQLEQQRLALQHAHESAPPQMASILEPAAASASTAGSLEGAASALPAAQPGNPGGGALNNVRLWGYGELYYTRPRDSKRTQADLARAVFGMGYRFDERTEFNSEYELEHAVASASDPGEFEVEQFYVDRELRERLGLRAGLFLMPFGLLNEHHEPTNFYGVQRNFVETLIIPSTWREGGISVHGDSERGVAFSAGLTTGVDLSRWQFRSAFPTFTTALQLEDNNVAPLQATHQELALANAHTLSQFLALSYFALPGVNLGGAAFTGKAVPASGTAGDSRVTLWEGHARWTPGKADLSAVYARGTIGDLASANLANPGATNPVPSAFYGYYLQAAYALWEHNEYRFDPFVRWEYFDMGSEYSGTVPAIPSGRVPLSAATGDLGSWPQNRDRVFTLGANLYVTPHVVVKLDYQWFDINREFSRLDAGLGLNF